MTRMLLEESWDVLAGWVLGSTLLLYGIYGPRIILIILNTRSVVNIIINKTAQWVTKDPAKTEAPSKEDHVTDLSITQH